MKYLKHAFFVLIIQGETFADNFEGEKNLTPDQSVCIFANCQTCFMQLVEEQEQSFVKKNIIALVELAKDQSRPFKNRDEQRSVTRGFLTARRVLKLQAQCICCC